MYVVLVSSKQPCPTVDQVNLLIYISIYPVERQETLQAVPEEWLVRVYDLAHAVGSSPGKSQRYHHGRLAS